MNVDPPEETELPPEEEDERPVPVELLSEAECPKYTVPIRCLRRIELLFLRTDYFRFCRQHPEDSWIFIEDRQPKGPVPFHEILFRLREGQSPIDVIHSSRMYDEDPSWSELLYKPAWSNSAVERIWTPGFWCMAAALTFLSVRLILPMGIRDIGSLTFVIIASAVAYFLTGRAPE